jgi:hypothetical protein
MLYNTTLQYEFCGGIYVQRAMGMSLGGPSRHFDAASN